MLNRPSKGGTEMKLLKIWGWLLLAFAIIIYTVGIFTGEFNRQMALLFWGTSIEAMLMLSIAVVCLLLSITVFLVLYSLKNK